jgi:hypothetical protein
MIANVILVIVSLALLGALLDTQDKLYRAQKQGKALHRWGSKAETYIKYLEAQNLAYQSTIETLTIKLDGKQYTLPLMPAKIAKPVVVAAKTEVTPAVAKPATVSTVSTIVTLGALSATEQRLIDKWHKDSRSESDMVKWLLNMRNNEAKKVAKVA